jgi:hypothetical protein
MSTAKVQAVGMLVTALETFKEAVLKDNSAKYVVRGTDGRSVCAEDQVVGGGSNNAFPSTIKFRVPYALVVPMHSPDWPPETWGMRLGKTVNLL